MDSIEPSPANARRGMAVLAFLAIAGAVILSVSLVSRLPNLAASRGDAYGTVMLVLGVLGLIWYSVWQNNARLLVGHNVIGHQDMLRRRRTWSSSEIGWVIDAPIAFRQNAPPRRYVFFVGVDGQRLIAASPAAWGDSAIERLIRAAGKPALVITRPISPQDLRRQYPGTLGWLYSNPTLVGGSFAVALIVFTVGLSLVLR